MLYFQQTKLPTVLRSNPDTEHELYVATFLLCGVIAAVLIAAAALYVIRRHARSREKLQNLTAPDTEASKDYQVGLFTFYPGAATELFEASRAGRCQNGIHRKSLRNTARNKAMFK
jgi:Flp pilus assembly protein TadB